MAVGIPLEHLDWVKNTNRLAGGVWLTVLGGLAWTADYVHASCQSMINNRQRAPGQLGAIGMIFP
jgi:hypothetical protein